MSKLHNDIKATIVRATVDHDTDTLEEALDEYVDAILDCIIKALPEYKYRGRQQVIDDVKQLLTDSKDK